MYLSLLELNPRSRRVCSELRDPYQMHRTLSKAFGDDPARYEKARCMFRVEEMESGPCALVQSCVEPDWSLLSVKPDFLRSEPKVKELKLNLRSGQVLAFRLRANPTVKREGKRWGLEKESDQLAWLSRKAQAGGFRLLSVRVKSEGKIESRTADGKVTTLFSARFDGVLEVTDPAVFLKTLESGIGSAKGFGFGLLSVAPVR